jgi:membrane-associated phospholipid phosphatase
MTSRISPDWLRAAAGLVAMFGALTVWVRLHGPLPGDKPALAFVTAHSTPSANVTGVYQFFAGLGSPYVAMLSTLAAAAVLRRNVGTREAGLVLAASAIALTERPIARLVGDTDAARELGLPAGGYPSGHALFVSATYGMLVWIAVRHGRREIAAILSVLMVLMAITRVLSRAHSVDEVLAGYLCGAAWTCLLLSTSTGPRREPMARRTKASRVRE